MSNFNVIMYRLLLLTYALNEMASHWLGMGSTSQTLNKFLTLNLQIDLSSLKYVRIYIAVFFTILFYFHTKLYYEHYYIN